MHLDLNRRYRRFSWAGQLNPGVGLHSFKISTHKVIKKVTFSYNYFHQHSVKPCPLSLWINKNRKPNQKHHVTTAEREIVHSFTHKLQLNLNNPGALAQIGPSHLCYICLINVFKQASYAMKELSLQSFTLCIYHDISRKLTGATAK